MGAAIPAVSRQQRSALARDNELRQQIITALRTGKKPTDIATQFADRGVTAQRVWNIATSLERLADRSPHRHTAMRSCLSCQHMFLSWGPGNRRCNTCAKTIDQAGPFEPSLGSHARIHLR